MIANYSKVFKHTSCFFFSKSSLTFSLSITSDGINSLFSLDFWCLFGSLANFVLQMILILSDISSGPVLEATKDHVQIIQLAQKNLDDFAVIFYLIGTFLMCYLIFLLWALMFYLSHVSETLSS